MFRCIYSDDVGRLGLLPCATCVRAAVHAAEATLALCTALHWKPSIATIISIESHLKFLSKPC